MSPVKPHPSQASLDLLPAAAEGDEARVEAALQAGADPHTLDCWGRNALMLAVEGSTFDTDRKARLARRRPEERGRVARALLERVVDPLAPSSIDPRRGSVLHRAAILGFPDIVRLLLAHGVDPEVQDNRGMTALRAIVPQDSARDQLDRACVQALLEGGATPFEADGFDHTPAHLLTLWNPEWAGPVLAEAARLQMARGGGMETGESSTGPRPRL